MKKVAKSKWYDFLLNEKKWQNNNNNDDINNC